MSRSYLLLALGLVPLGCAEPTFEELPDVGQLAGEFRCPIVDAGQRGDFDLGPADFEGDLDYGDYEDDLHTQGCFARRIGSDNRGDVISVLIFQQRDFDGAQVLEINLPLTWASADGTEHDLSEGDELPFIGGGAFGSMWELRERGDDPRLWLRNAGGSVHITRVGEDEGDWIEGHFDDLKLGEL